MVTGYAGAGKTTLCDGLIKQYGGNKIALADALKQFCDSVFGTDRNNKNGFSPIRAKDFSQVVPSFVYLEEAYLTNRQVYQYFGTEIVRKICPDAWVNVVKKTINDSDRRLWYIDDVRFPNEVIGLASDPNIDATIIRLTRKVTDMKHESEIALDNFDFSPWHNIVIDNSNLTIDQTLLEVVNRL